MNVLGEAESSALVSDVFTSNLQAVNHAEDILLLTSQLFWYSGSERGIEIALKGY